AGAFTINPNGSITINIAGIYIADARVNLAPAVLRGEGLASSVGITVPVVIVPEGVNGPTLAVKKTP
ncbi:hypothetical protein ACT453_49350, partial [Bacillus sp. D-CC]